MNLVEAPDHAGPVAPPHAPERLRTLLAEGRDAQNDETAQSERAGSIFFSFEIEFRFLFRIRIFLPWGGRSGGAEVPPLWFSTLP